jgi:hypothetical protein
MDKGLLIVIAAGIAFGYFALSQFNIASENDDSEWSGPASKKNPYEQYYKKDVLGDRVLDVNALPLDRAKAVWRAVPIKDDILALLPDFDTAKTEAGNRIVKGTFRNYVLKKIEELQGKFLVGEVTLDEAKRRLSELK